MILSFIDLAIFNSIDSFSVPSPVCLLSPFKPADVDVPLRSFLAGVIVYIVFSVTVELFASVLFLSAEEEFALLPKLAGTELENQKL